LFRSQYVGIACCLGLGVETVSPLWTLSLEFKHLLQPISATDCPLKNANRWRLVTCNRYITLH
jgi:hypothetical protein